MFKFVRCILNECLNNEEGNASIEYVLVISIIVTMFFAIFSVSVGLKKQFNTSACNINCTIVESKYRSYLSRNGIAHSELVYSQFINECGIEICPEKNIVTFINGRLQCNGHYKDDHIDNDGNQDESVPFL